MSTLTRDNSLVPTGIIAGVGAILISALYLFTVKFEKPVKEEIVAMEILAGYKFAYEGNTNVIRHFRRIQPFQSQHKLMPYLVMVADKFKVYDWPKEWPIRIHETENEIIITFPAEGEFLEERRFLWGAPYLEEVVIDKKTMKVVSALRGG